METYGEEGVAEVERAFETINKTFKEMYSSDSYLDTVPTQVTRYNYRAMALGLVDIYSVTLAGLTERLGLASPERFCWTLRDVFCHAMLRTRMAMSSQMILHNSPEYDPSLWRPLLM